MKTIKNITNVIASISILILFIIDAQTAAAGVMGGIDMCLKAIFPSLFPFFLITSYLNSVIYGYRIPGIQFITHRLRIPIGGEFILLLGLTGGYPVGAKLIADLCSTKKINKQTANILLGYCNNAGPAFIFGIAGAAFTSPMIPLVLWIIHIFSAIVTGFLLPKPELSEFSAVTKEKSSVAQSMKTSTSACVTVCGWVIVFKILLSYLCTWFPNLFTSSAGIVLTGLLELSNGCIAATQISNPAIRFILFAVFFAFGGFCVFLQTISVTESLGCGLYIHGKIIQTGISIILSCVCSRFLFSDYKNYDFSILIMIILSVTVIFFTVRHAKNCGIR